MDFSYKQAALLMYKINFSIYGVAILQTRNYFTLPVTLTQILFAFPKLRKSFSSSSSSVTMIVGTENPERIGGVDDTMRLPDLRLQP